MKLGKQEINKNKRIFIIAEAGINYNNDLKLAYKMIDAAYYAGADAIKFQTWITDKMQLKNSKKPNYQKEQEPSLVADPLIQYADRDQLEKMVKVTEQRMKKAAKELDFITAAQYRDEIFALKKQLKELD